MCNKKHDFENTKQYIQDDIKRQIKTCITTKITYENTTCIFEKDFYKKNGASLKFQHKKESLISTLHFVTMQVMII